MKKRNELWGVVIIMVLIFGCDETYIPKPKGYPHIDLPTKNYVSYASACPINLEIPTYSKVELLAENDRGCRFNLSFPRLKARVHFSYFPIEDNLSDFLEDAYRSNRY
jgi:hypothetical protein